MFPPVSWPAEEDAVAVDGVPPAARRAGRARRRRARWSCSGSRRAGRARCTRGRSRCSPVAPPRRPTTSIAACGPCPRAGRRPRGRTGAGGTRAAAGRRTRSARRSRPRGRLWTMSYRLGASSRRVVQRRGHELDQPGHEVEPPVALGGLRLSAGQSRRLELRRARPRGRPPGRRRRGSRAPGRGPARGVGRLQVGDGGVGADDEARHRQGELASSACPRRVAAFRQAANRSRTASGASLERLAATSATRFFQAAAVRGRKLALELAEVGRRAPCRRRPARPPGGCRSRTSTRSSVPISFVGEASSAAPPTSRTAGPCGGPRSRP